MHGTAHWFALGTLYTGGTVVLSPDRRLDPPRLWELIAREQVTFLVIVGDAFARPLVEALDTLDPSLDLSSLTVVLSGGAILSPSVKQLWVQKLPGHDPHRRLRLVGVGRPGQQRHRGRRTDRDRAALSGRPRDHRARRQPRAGRPSAWSAGSPGAVTSPSGTTRTRRRPRRRSRSSTACGGRCPATTRASRTTARSPCSGAGSVSINTGGEKVYPEEVESAVKSHPAVFDAVVVGVPDERWGERVVAVAQLRPGATLTAEELDQARARAARRLQGAARSGAGRRRRALAVGEARLPVGARHRRGASSSAVRSSAPR